MRLIILIVITSLFISCKSSTKEKKIEKTESKVLTTKNLPQLTLPLSNTCGSILMVYDKEEVGKLISDLPENLRFGGILKNADKYVAVILLDTYADEQIHYLTTVNKKGKIIEKLDLFSNKCSEDAFFWGEAKYTIDKDLKIVQTDSSATYKRDKAGEIIKESIVTSSHKFKFYVDNNGRIKKYGV